MAQYIKADGTTSEIAPKNAYRGFTLEELQPLIGGYIEIVYLADGRRMVVNEEGLIHKLPFNKTASRLYPHSPIVGNVLIGTPDEIQ